MLAAMKKELAMRHHELEDRKIKSLYFGGGTPSILSVDEIKSVTDEVLKYFDFDENIEVTLEANPDDLSKDFVKNLNQSYINRLSIGTQSFHDEDLRLMNRAHNASEAESSIKRSQDAGFENISIDLIYGSPTSGMEIWKENLNKTIALEVPHISSYALTVEPKTALNQWIKTQKIAAPKEEEQNAEFYYMIDFLKNHGFLHYEISNFAKEGFQSKHNSAYWEYLPYLGIGPSAHSYDGKVVRSWNLANNQLYINNLNQNKLPKEQEVLTLNDQFNEMLMIGLRTSRGTDLSAMKAKFSSEMMENLQKNSQQKLADGVLLIEHNYLKIPEQHWFMADGIAADLFMV